MFILKYTLYSKTFLKSDNCLHYLFSINYFSLALLTACPRGLPSGAKDFGGLTGTHRYSLEISLGRYL